MAVGVVLFASARANAATELLFGVELSTDNLISFNSDAPGSILTSHAINGLQTGEAIRGIDMGPNGLLYGLGSSSRLYTIDASTGQATAVGGQFSTVLNGTTFGFDIGPTGARVSSDLGQALLINISTGVATPQSSLFYAAGDPHFGTAPRVDALALNPANGTWIAGDSLGTPPSGIVTAFQSYPTLLTGDGFVPRALRSAGSGVDLGHRDARLAIGETRDGRLLVAMTRFDALGEAAGAVPIGPTTPEMVAVMGALGVRAAVMLDGGISAQMLMRNPVTGETRRWPGWRKVPLALIVRPRGR